MTCSHDELQNYYDALPDVYGYDALCKMDIPKELPGKTALDVACRRGKGVYKLAEQVGPTGRALGCEWRADMLERARAGEARAIEKCGFAESNMEFLDVFPEELCDVVEESCADFVYVNCVLNLFYNPAEALAQIRRALKPGGLLVCDTVLSSGPRNAKVVKRARELGNAVQAAPPRKDFMTWIASAGFDITSIGAFASSNVDPCTDADGKATVAVAESDEPASFVATSIHVYKPDEIDRHRKKLMDDISKFR